MSGGMENEGGYPFAGCSQRIPDEARNGEGHGVLLSMIGSQGKGSFW